MCKNGDGNEKLDVFLTILTVSCLSHLKELVLWCKLLLYQVPHPTSSVFSNLFAFYVGWGKSWGERKVIMYKGTPAKCFFSVLT